MPRRNGGRIGRGPEPDHSRHVMPPPTPIGLGLRRQDTAERPAFTPPLVPFDRLETADRVALRQAVRLLRQYGSAASGRPRTVARRVGYCDERGKLFPGVVLPAAEAVMSSRDMRAAARAAEAEAADAA